MLLGRHEPRTRSNSRPAPAMLQSGCRTETRLALDAHDAGLEKTTSLYSDVVYGAHRARQARGAGVTNALDAHDATAFPNVPKCFIPPRSARSTRSAPQSGCRTETRLALDARRRLDAGSVKRALGRPENRSEE